ncbi:MAG: Ig-like domain-containing protein [Verrucomicrobiota bacterium]
MKSIQAISRSKPASAVVAAITFLAVLLAAPATVQANPPALPYAASPTVGPAPLSVQFNSSSTDSYGNIITQWFWSFGDGATTNAQNPVHVYTNNGTFNPVLVATNINGATVAGIGPAITIEMITNVLLNGSFQTGDFTDWTLPLGSNYLFVTSDPLYVLPGNTYGAQLGSLLGYLTQPLTTTPGTAYVLSFWLDNTNDLTPPPQAVNEFTVTWDGQTVLSLTNFTDPNWTNFVVGMTPTQTTNTSTILSFEIQMENSWFGLDQVDVEALVVAPTSQTVECGSTATFSLASNNENFVSYQWYGHPQDANSFPILGATNSVLTLTNISAGPVVSYFVVCSNANGSFTSSVAPLTVVDVSPAPAITPANQTVECGSTVTFGLTNAANASSYQWFSPDLSSPIAAATNATVTFTNALVGVSNYIVEVATPCGSFTSATATLTVIDTISPVITLLGANPMQMVVNSPFNDPGATVNDSCAGTSVTLSTNSSLVNPNLPGAYTVTYTANDIYGNSTTNTRTVNVVVATYDNLVVSTANLLGFWPFTTSSQANSVVNGYTGAFAGGAFIGGAGSGPTLVDTPGNTAVILNGSPAYVDTSLVGGLSTSSAYTNQGSIIGWFNLNNLPATAGHIFTIAAESQLGNDFDLQIDANNTIGFYTDNGSSTSDPTALTASDLNVWHFVAGTFISGTSRDLYLDGMLVARSGPGTHDPTNGGTFSMGASDVFANRYFQGALADVAVFNRQLSATEIANFYAAATTPISVSIASPTNIASFTTNEAILFSADAIALNGIQQVTLYTNSVLVASGSSTNISIVLSNLPTGSYALTAVATDINNLSVTSAVVHVTVNIPGTSLIDFDAVNASTGPASGAALTAYLANYGVSVSNVTGGTTLAVQEGQNVIDGSGNQLTTAFSQPNLLTQFGTNGPISYTLVFNTPCTSVSWERAALLASGGGLVGPSWSAYAFDINGNEISQVGEGQILSLTSMPAKAFTLYGSNIAYVTFAADNTLSPLDTLPLDDLLLSTNALGPIPQITLTASSVSSAEPGGITLTAQASESSGTISSISFYENQGLIGSPALTVSGPNNNAAITVTSLAPGTYTFNAVVTDANGVSITSSNVTLTVMAVAGVAVINFDDLTMLDTSLGAVGGTNLSDYLGNVGITLSNATLGTRLEAISETSFSGNELPLPTSLPNLFTQVGSIQPVTFSLYFATNLQSFSFTRVGLTTNGPSGITHPAWTASAMDASGNVLESVSEPLLFSSNNIPPRTFTLYGNGIASVRFNSDSQQKAAFAAVLLDDLVLDANTNNSINPLSISLTQPVGLFTAPANIPLTPNVADGYGLNYYVAFYSGPTLIGTNTGGNSTFIWTNVLNGSYEFTAQVIDTSFGYALFSSPAITVPVAVGGKSLVVNFDDPNAVANLPGYLATNGMMSITTNSPGTGVAAENQTDAILDGSVIPSSLPNLLTQTNQSGSNGPVSFTVAFSNLLTQFSFTRPELLANASVSLPAWQAEAFDALGQPLAVISAPPISSATNVPAQTYTLTNAINGAGIGSVEFSSDGTGFDTFNAVLLDDFVLTTNGILAPSVLITGLTNGQILTNLAIALTAGAADGSGTVASVAFYYGGTNLIGTSTNSSSPFSLVWTNAPTNNGVYTLTAVAVNTFAMSSTSAPVVITLASGFAIVTPPASQTIPLGGNAFFGVATTLTPGAYQWQSNGVAINGADSSTFSISNAPLNAAGSYTVVVTSGGQSISSAPAILTVVSPPSISGTSSLQPVVNIGDTFTLSVTASDPDPIPFYYQWKLNGTSIPGATNSSFTVSNAQPFNSGAYDVVVANAAAFTNSPIFTVEVNFPGNVPTTFNFDFADSIAIDPLIGPVSGINSNSPATGEIGTIAGKPAGRFLWYNWTASFTGTISLDTLGSSFDTLMGVYIGNSVNNLTSVGQDDDSGGFFTSLVSFNCVQGTTYEIAVAGYNGADGTVILGLAPGTGYRVLNPGSGAAVPVITQQPSNQIVNVGQTVTLSVTALDATAYQWYFGNTPVVGATSNMLVISNFPGGAVGVYYALVANAVGAAQSEPAAVELLNPEQTAGAPNTLLLDKFIDAQELTAGVTPEHTRPELGGDTAGYTLSQSFSTVGATKEEGEPNHAGQPGGASYWYSYKAQFAGTLRFDTTNSTFNTILAIYTGPGTSFSTLVPVGAAYSTNYVLNGQPSVTVSNVFAGAKYYIAIDGYLGASGNARLNVYFTPAALTPGPGIISITNNQTVVAITSPRNNYLTTSSNITIKGTVRGTGANPPETNLLVTLNGTQLPAPTLGHVNASGVLVPVRGDIEEVAQESFAWQIPNVALTNGANVITAQSINVQATNLETVSVPATHTVFLVTSLPSSLVKAPLTVLASPPSGGKVTGQANNASLEINKVYTVNAAPFANRVFTNWSSGTNTNSLLPLPNGQTLSFLMSSNLVLQANFITNPFISFAGTYDGLFSPASGVTEESSGFFTAAIPASSHGAYSAKLLLNGGSYPFSGTFGMSGSADQILTLADDTLLAVALHLDLAATNNQMTGSVTEVANNGWTAALLANRAVFNGKTERTTNYAGKYTLVIPPGDTAPTHEPAGYGYATLTNNPAGLVAVSGRLSDGTSFSQSVPVATNGDIPLYASLYSHKGSLQGWLTVTDTTNTPSQTIVGANLAWIKVSSPPGSLYAEGFTNTNITVLGSFYMPPPAGSSGLDLTNGTLIISNGNSGEVLTYSNLSIVDNKLGNQTAAGNPPNALEGTITPATGILTVTFQPTGSSKNIVAKGVVLQDDSPTNGAGWFLDADQSGSFILQQP